MSVKFLDLTIPHLEIREELNEAFHRVVTRSSFILGPEVAAFEDEFARYCEADHCVTVGNGCDALEIALRALGIGPGDEVIVPGTTFAATWFAVSRVGAAPVPVEVTEDTVTLDPSAFEAAIGEKTRAVIPVHLYGHPAEMDRICAIARRNGLYVIEDAAQAHGATYAGRRAGSLGDVAAFSFYPGKNLGALGDAGAVLTNDADVAERLRRIRNYGSDEKYVHREIAGNSRMDEMQAAFLRVKLAHLDAWNQQRKMLARRYHNRLAKLAPHVLAPIARENCEPSWHLYVVRASDRDRVRKELERREIGTLIHYPIPNHKQEAYSAMNQHLSLPITERLAESVLSLPMGPHLSEEDVDEVCDALAAALGVAA
jgi:dTDP-3-amino-3,4,6-trideoxy-alpha-D-glucose transaminase